MKKITFIAAIFAGLVMSAQETIFEDDFESYEDFLIADVGDWTLVDKDGLPTYGFNGIAFPNTGVPMAFIVFNSEETSPPIDPSDESDWSARSGEKCMTSFAAAPGPNNDWLISPQMTLGTSGNELDFWAKAADGTYNDEKFNIAISTTDANPDSFTMLEQDNVPSAIVWQQFIVDLDAYAGEDVYIAINHVGNDQFGFQVDDFKVTAMVLGVNDEMFKGFTFFVNNDELNVSGKNIMQNISLYNMIGQEVISQKLNSDNAIINISALQSGVYLSKVSIDGATKTFKIVKN